KHNFSPESSSTVADVSVANPTAVPTSAVKFGPSISPFQPVQLNQEALDHKAQTGSLDKVETWESCALSEEDLEEAKDSREDPFGIISKILERVYKASGTSDVLVGEQGSSFSKGSRARVGKANNDRGNKKELLCMRENVIGVDLKGLDTEKGMFEVPEQRLRSTGGIENSRKVVNNTSKKPIRTLDVKQKCLVDRQDIGGCEIT
ncbi:26466_t:CDS:2, partial [Gigaspora margarita]